MYLPVGNGIPARLRTRWTERGRPHVVAQSRRGFGSRLVERALAAKPRGPVAIELRLEGIVCEVYAPLSSQLE